jgi:uncharacterized membrane protein
MTTPMIFQGFLLFHLIGVILFAGTTMTDYVTLRQFWKQYGQDRTKAVAILQAMAGFPVLMRIGIIAIILSGVGMMGLTHGVFGEQTWFRIKFGLVLLLILNYLLTGRRQALKLKEDVQENAAGMTAQLAKRRRNLSLFQYAQLLLFFVIILLSVFRFN